MSNSKKEIYKNAFLQFLDDEANEFKSQVSDEINQKFWKNYWILLTILKIANIIVNIIQNEYVISGYGAFSILFLPLQFSLVYSKKNNMSLLSVLFECFFIAFVFTKFIESSIDLHRENRLNLSQFSGNIISINLIFFIINQYTQNISSKWIFKSICFYSHLVPVFAFLFVSQSFMWVIFLSVVTPFYFYQSEQTGNDSIFTFYVEQKKNSQWRKIFNSYTNCSIFIFGDFSRRFDQGLPQIDMQLKISSEIANNDSLILANEVSKKQFPGADTKEILEKLGELQIKMTGVDVSGEKEESILSLIHSKILKIKQEFILGETDEFPNCTKQKVRNKEKETKEQTIKAEIQQKYNQVYDVKFVQILFEEKPALMVMLENSSLKLLYQRKREMNNFQDRMMNTITHNLQTPINSIILQSQGLMKKKSIQSAISSNEDIIKNAEWLLSMVNDMIDYTKLNRESKQKIVESLKPSFFDLRDLIERVCYILSIHVRKNRVKFETSYYVDKKSDLIICSDFERLQRILLNLVSNALKFTFQGFVKIIVEKVRDSQLSVQVIDTGIGISQQKLNSLLKEDKFNPDIPKSTETYTDGAGIGLMISRLLIRELGPEDLLIQSEINRGTVLSFQIEKRLDLKIIDLQDLIKNHNAICKCQNKSLLNHYIPCFNHLASQQLDNSSRKLENSKCKKIFNGYFLLIINISLICAYINSLQDHQHIRDQCRSVD